MYTVLCQYTIELAIIHSSGELLRTQIIILVNIFSSSDTSYFSLCMGHAL